MTMNMIGMLFFILIITFIGTELLFCDDPLAMFMGMLIILFEIILVICVIYGLHKKPAESQTVQESQIAQEQETESEDLSQLTINGENVTYVDGEVINKLSNNRIQVSIYEETYNIVVESDVYDTVEVGDTINCVVYHDIAKVNYVTE